MPDQPINDQTNNPTNNPTDNTNNQPDNRAANSADQNHPQAKPAQQPIVARDKEAIQQEQSTKKIDENMRKGMEKRLEESSTAAGVAPVDQADSSKPIEDIFSTNSSDILNLPPNEQEEYISRNK